MRKLLIKLVAIETALVGWLSYWLFLVYANNPSVADQLSSSLQKFPQLSFSTIDIAVLVIIAALSVTLAFKFQRGLRPGIRLERALQMLENLMKRNLILESQVAELKIEKSHTTTMPTAPIVAPTTDETRQGSWEKAFRTPLEAGPPAGTRPSGIGSDEIPFGRQTGVPPPRIEPKPQPTQSDISKPTIMIDDKGIGRSTPPPTVITSTTEKPAYMGPSTSASSSWEDSPKFIGETRGILTPSAPPRRVPAVSESGGLKQPYIPAPAPKPWPPSVIVGPMTPPTSPKITPPPTTPRILGRPSSRLPPSSKSSTPIASPRLTPETPKPENPTTLALTPSPSPSQVQPSLVENFGTRPDASEAKTVEDTTKAGEKTRVRDSQATKKKLPDEESKT